MLSKLLLVAFLSACATIPSSAADTGHLRKTVAAKQAAIQAKTGATLGVHPPEGWPMDVPFTPEDETDIQDCVTEHASKSTTLANHLEAIRQRSRNPENPNPSPIRFLYRGMSDVDYDQYYASHSSYQRRDSLGAFDTFCGGSLGWGGAYVATTKQEPLWHAAGHSNLHGTGVTLLNTPITEEMKAMIGVPISRALGWCGNKIESNTPGVPQFKKKECMKRLQNIFSWFWPEGKDNELKFNNTGVQGTEIPYALCWSGTAAAAEANPNPECMEPPPPPEPEPAPGVAGGGAPGPEPAPGIAGGGAGPSPDAVKAECEANFKERHKLREKVKRKRLDIEHAETLEPSVSAQLIAILQAEIQVKKTEERALIPRWLELQCHQKISPEERQRLVQEVASGNF
jgi:hypothetical protein